jgi:hypothetical protein
VELPDRAEHERVAEDVPADVAGHDEDVERRGRGRGGEERRRLVVGQLFGELEDEEHEQDRRERGRQPQEHAPLRPERRHRDGGSPGRQRGLLEAELAVHRGREPVALREHLARGGEIPRLHDVRLERSRVRDEREPGEQQEEREPPRPGSQERPPRTRFLT